MAKTHLRTQIDQEPQVGHKSVHGLWKPSEATRSAPSRDSPPVQGKTSLPSMHSILKDQEWCIYGIIYHYAPFSLRNQMVTLSGPSYMIPNEVPKSITIFKGGLLSYSVWQFLGGYQKTIPGPQPPGPAVVGLSILTRTILRVILRGNQSYSIIVKASSTQNSLDNSIGAYRYSSHTRPAINPEVRPSLIQKYRASTTVTSQQLQPEAGSSRRREELSPLLFPAAQVFQQRDCWPIRVTREDPNIESEN
ncbi:hypothetical protein O181_031537 [Austropuccinia psidii MF-1]|uniref:Uncharacterized protein n=1 Tax=Austropuccinia psidii MF-1 TaxID=1389203 RepID=A0A9Q3D0V3_9BASI|nr:hypothetical protein [Austropuccinia psidii MF-1]